MHLDLEGPRGVSCPTSILLGHGAFMVLRSKKSVELPQVNDLVKLVHKISRMELFSREFNRGGSRAKVAMQPPFGC